jgi:hypothetical protein
MGLHLPRLIQKIKNTGVKVDNFDATGADPTSLSNNALKGSIKSIIDKYLKIDDEYLTDLWTYFA